MMFKNKLCFAVLSTLMILGCDQSMSPTGASQPPNDGAVFTYNSVVSQNGRDSSFQEVWTTKQTGEGFDAKRDSLRTPYKTRTDGDIEVGTSCDWLKLGILSHATFMTRESSTPAKHDGMAFTDYIRETSSYSGLDNIKAAGKTYACTKISIATTVREVAEAGNEHTFIVSVATYWYSQELHYFVLYDVKSYLEDSLVSSTSSTLISIK
jgi:hypothetical protein